MNERPIEYAYVFRKIRRYCPNSVLDVGTGKTALPALMSRCIDRVEAIDVDPEVCHNNTYWKVNCLDITKSRYDTMYDMITCVSVLEHIHDFDMAVENMIRMLNPDGVLILTHPYKHNQYVHRVRSEGFCQMFSSVEVSRWTNNNRICMIDSEYWDSWTGYLWGEGDRIQPERISTPESQKHHLACFTFRKFE